MRRIGIDEISYKRGYKFLTVVVDHDSGRLVWPPGKERATLEAFFALLGDQRCQAVSLVSADGAEYIAKVVAKSCPNATLCADPFHVVSSILNLLAWWLRNLDRVDASAMAEIIERTVLTPIGALQRQPPAGLAPGGPGS